MKSNSLLSLDEQKKLYERYSVDTLESLDTLYYYIIDEKPPISFNIVYQKKYDENADNYNGREEVTESMLLDNFDISEITNSLKDLSDEELSVISKPIYKAISKTNPCDSESKLIQKLREFDKEFNKEIEKRFTPIYEGMLLKDVRDFFLKFGMIGLENFDTILNYCSHERKEEIRRVKNEAEESKSKKYKNSVSSLSTMPKDFRIVDFKAVFSTLTDLELEFLHSLVEEAATYLNCIQMYTDYYIDEIEDFDLSNYPIKEVNELLYAINIEQTVTRPKQYAPMNLELETGIEKTK